MPLIRAIFTLVVAASLAAMPARVGAVGMIGDAGTVVASMADCATMDGSSCQPAEGVTAGADDMAPMSDGCDRTGDKGTALPGACSTYCHSLPVLPMIVFAAVDIVLGDTVAPPVVAAMDDIGISPEPHPPKLV
jgi:hypothetical protein